MTVITGTGFLLRFDDPVESVRIRFGNYKADGLRSVWAFLTSVDYVRDPLQTSQHNDGNVTGVPDGAAAIDFVQGSVPSGSDGHLDLTVSDAQGRISSLRIKTHEFLTSLIEIEFEPAGAVVPLPPAAWTGLGLLGCAAALRRIRRRRARRARPRHDDTP